MTKQASIMAALLMALDVKKYDLTELLALLL